MESVTLRSICPLWCIILDVFVLLLELIFVLVLVLVLVLVFVFVFALELVLVIPDSVCTSYPATAMRAGYVLGDALFFDDDDDDDDGLGLGGV